MKLFSLLLMICFVYPISGYADNRGVSIDDYDYPTPSANDFNTNNKNCIDRKECTNGENGVKTFIENTIIRLEHPYIKLEFKYPYFLSSIKINSLIDAAVSGEWPGNLSSQIAAADRKRPWEEDKKDLCDGVNTESYGDDQYCANYWLSYEIHFLNERFASIAFDRSYYLYGMLHVIQYMETVNFDFLMKKKIRLGDIFLPESKHLQELARISNERLPENPCNEPVKATQEYFSNWYFTEKSIVIHWDVGFLCGYAYGAHEVEIDFSELSSFLRKKEFPNGFGVFD